MIFIPTYPLDFKPMEQGGVITVNHLLRQAELRSVNAPVSAIRVAYPKISAQDSRQPLSPGRA